MGLPKAELHVHLEGTLEPDTVLLLARRNNILLNLGGVELDPSLPQHPGGIGDNTTKGGEEGVGNRGMQHSSKEKIIQRRMGECHDLPSFIRVYTELLRVMVTEQDFYEVAMGYMQRARAQGVLYVEMFFDPQMHTSRGVPLDTLMQGLRRARDDAALRDPPLAGAGPPLLCSFILCFNRDRPVADAMLLLDQALAYRDLIVGVGTDNPEHLGFPREFVPVYEKASAAGFRLTAHCDVDFQGSEQNIHDCIHLLSTERIDHGINILDNPSLIAHAREKHVAFTVCPTIFYTPTLGQFSMGYFHRCAQGAKAMLEAGMLVSLGSDDPGIMCSQYLGDIYVSVCNALELSKGIC